MKFCEICGKANAEVHHIIFRSEASYMANFPINFKYLCSKCHRGKKGPHMDEAVNLNYKRELQNKLYSIFSAKGYYKESEIKERLDISTNEVCRLVKGLKRYKEGFKKEDIIRTCLGGKLYMKEEEQELLNLMDIVRVV